MTMRILLLSVDFLPQIGGISLMAHHLANALVDCGADVHVVVPVGADVGGGWTSRYTLIEDVAARVKDREGPLWTLKEGQRATAFIGECADRFRPERILLLHPFYYGPAAIEAASARGIPVSVYFHGFELRSQLISKTVLRSLIQVLRGYGPTLRSLTLKTARQANEVLVNSSYTAGQMRRTGSRRPVHVTGCGVPNEDFKAAQAAEVGMTLEKMHATRSRFGLPKDLPVVGTMGRLVESKNIPMLLEALARSDRFHAAVIGDGPDGAALRTHARALGVDGRVSWISGVSETEKWDLLACLDLFCLLSREAAHGRVEGFGIVLLEAAAAGTPVIATASGGMTDVVADFETGLQVEVGDVKGLNKAINVLLGDPSLGKRLVAGARERIASDFNWAIIAERLILRWNRASRSGETEDGPAR